MCVLAASLFIGAPGLAAEPAAVESYLEAQRADIHAQLAKGREDQAVVAVDKVLSLAAATRNPADAKPALARALADAIGALAAIGQTERAYGLFRVTAVFIAGGLDPQGADRVAFDLTAAGLLQDMGDVKGSAPIIEAAMKVLAKAPPSAGTRERLTRAQRLKAVTCIAAGGVGCPPGAMSPSAAQTAVFVKAGEDLARFAALRSPMLGVPYRPGAQAQIMIAFALAQSGSSQDDALAFDLFQLAGRQGPSFDADALSTLAGARTETQRRSIHQALRLRARRDRAEREMLQAMIARARAPAAGQLPQYDPSARRILADYSHRIALAEADIAGASVDGDGERVTLARFQAALRPDEAALAVAPVRGGLAYMCVRRDRVVRARRVADLAAAQADVRVIQAALTAAHAPSQALDAQFPVQASMRLYDVFVRPFEACLKDGDHILWLPSLAATAFPLAVLLDRAPPRAGDGYDLAEADWLVRRHAVTYAGSAAVIVAARMGGAAPPSDFDFLGVGDPVLAAASGDQALARLPPLPETRTELEQSSSGLRAATVLTGAAATEQAFRGQMVGAYRYLSFATHGLMRQDLQGLSDPALVLTPGSAADPANDGLLTASEIADLSLSARFVALSACNTANFDLSRVSSDLPALASAFAVAGAPATLATLWPVDSQSTQQVVAGTFAALKTDAATGPAQALAQAQRAFLAAPPGRAYLHPRFWAAFVVLGDGGAAGPVANPAPLTAVTTLTQRGGEVVGIRRAGQQVQVRFIGDRDGANRHGAGTLVTDPAGAPAWRRETSSVGATRFMVELGPQLVVGGYATGSAGHAEPVLESFDRQTGAPGKIWRGTTPQGLDGFVLAGAPTGTDAAAFVVAHLRFALDGEGSQLQVMTIDKRLAPRLLFSVQPPSGGTIDDVTLAATAKVITLTYSRRYPARGGPAVTAQDDFDAPLCGPLPVTWIETHDTATGRLIASRAVTGLIVTAAVQTVDGVRLGGARKPSCSAETRAAVLMLGAGLEPRFLYEDRTLGPSEVRGLSAMSGGRLFVAAAKRDIFDYSPPAALAASGAYGVRALPIALGGMLLTLAKDGKASAPRMLDAGGPIYISAAEAGRPGDVLVGGAMGEQAAIFHLAVR